MTREQEACVRLALVEGMGPLRFKALAGKFTYARRILAAPDSELGSMAPYVRRARGIPSSRLPREEVWCRTEDDFSPTLADIYDPPIVLWYRGRRPEAKRPRVAIVGTRRATPYGRHHAARLARAISQKGVEVVSGLALGIDGAAHRGALEGAGGTIGVLGCGIDRVFPSLHRNLAREIEKNGTLLSEFPPGTQTRAGHFPRRNRILCGLADGLVVVEAGITGGAMLTASLAEGENRPIFAIPGDIGRPSSEGTNHLLERLRAATVVDPEWLLGELGLRSSPPPPNGATLPEMGPDSVRLVSRLETSPQPLDALCMELDVDVSAVLPDLLRLELMGLVRQYPGKQFALA